jgi:2-polyprenyl-6-methoxyphenol hydroxylase-like FAD-dependent oxidoreductase
MRIAIVGAGIGGCALALSLEAAGFVDVTLYETAGALRELGVGINVLPHAARELTELGLGEAIDAVAVRTGTLSYHDRFGHQIWEEPRGLAAGYKWPQWSVHRGRLLGVLHTAVMARLGPDAIVHGRRVTPNDLSELNADVVVACDGVHSILRTLVAPNEQGPLWNGVTMWRGVSVAEPFLGGRRMAMAGRLHRRTVIYPIHDLPDGRQLINWVAEEKTAEGRPMPRHDWSAVSDVAEPMRAFHDYQFDWLDVPSLFALSDEVLAYPMCDRDPLPTWRHGSMTLLGDAAHPMYPVGSNGASQAILDARTLARELALQPTIGEALDAYEAIRLPATSAVVLANRQVGPERCMEVIAERAPDGFTSLDDIISPEELHAMVTSYRTTAGFDPKVLNERDSLSVPRR